MEQKLFYVLSDWKNKITSNYFQINVSKTDDNIQRND